MTTFTWVFGGSFDPPHLGHVLATAWALSKHPASEVWWTPVASHAFGKGLTPFALRAHLVRLAIAPFGGRVALCEVERELPAPSRTWATMNALEAMHPDRVFGLVIGSDLLSEVDRWHRWPDICARWPLLVLPRGGWGDPPSADSFRLPQVSSTTAREAWTAGDHAWLLSHIPSAVLAAMRDLRYPSTGGAEPNAALASPPLDSGASGES